jgi:hypothetical protein
MAGVRSRGDGGPGVGGSLSTRSTDQEHAKWGVSLAIVRPQGLAASASWRLRM